MLLLAACGTNELASTEDAATGNDAASPAQDAPPAPAPAAAPDPDTAEFAAWRTERLSRPSPERTEQADGYTYTLACGSLAVSDNTGAELWRSSEFWWVDDFALGDVDGDGQTDLLFSLWKSWSFGIRPPLYDTDSPEVRNHLFLYTMRQGEAMELWCSSNLPRQILCFSLDPSGETTPVRSGMLLHTTERDYDEAAEAAAEAATAATGEPCSNVALSEAALPEASVNLPEAAANGSNSGDEAEQHTYAWEKWGFVPL